MLAVFSYQLSSPSSSSTPQAHSSKVHITSFREALRVRSFVCVRFMEDVNVNASVLLPQTKEQLDDNQNVNNNGAVDYHLNKLLASHLDKNPQEIAEASRCAAKAARANADEKAAAAARAVAAAKSALDLIASFPKQAVVSACLDVGREKHVAADDHTDDLLLLSKDQELQSSKLQPNDNATHGIMSTSSSSCEHNKNDQLPIGLRERPNTEHDAISNKTSVVDFSGLGTELGSSNRLVELNHQYVDKEQQKRVSRKRGRPKSK